MKRIIFIILVLFSIMPAAISAQNGKLLQMTPEERSKMLTEWMQENLNLSAQQSSEISVLNLKYANEMEKLKSDEISRIKKISIAKEVDKRRTEDYKKILSTNQFDTFIKKKKEAIKMIRDLAKEFKNN